MAVGTGREREGACRQAGIEVAGREAGTNTDCARVVIAVFFIFPRWNALYLPYIARMPTRRPVQDSARARTNGRRLTQAVIRRRVHSIYTSVKTHHHAHAAREERNV